MAKNITEQIEEFAEKANAAMAEARIQFDTLATLHSDERREMRQTFQAEKEKMREGFHAEMDKMRKHYGKVIAGIIVPFALLLGGIIGGAVYVFSNYEIASFTQEQYIGGDGDNTIEDGIHHTPTS